MKVRKKLKFMNESQSNEAADLEKEKIDVYAIIENNVKINLILTIFDQMNFPLIQKMIEATPPELKNTENFKVLVAAAVFYDDLKNIYESADSSENPADEQKLIIS